MADLSKVGLVQWFNVGQHERVEQAMEDLRSLRVGQLRTGVSWADWHCPGGPEWYDWLIPRIARQFDMLPCLLYTPPSLGVRPKVSSPPREPKLYADFLDAMLDRYGKYFDYVELWNEPNNVREWDWTLDADWLCFCEMIGSAAYWARHRGKKTVLGGMSPVDPNWLEMMFRRGVMEHIDVVGIHGFPAVFDASWEGWPEYVARVRRVLRAQRSKASIWITEAGVSTWRHEERRQADEFLLAAQAPVQRMYWYSLYDLPVSHSTVDGFHSDDREYHFGMRTEHGEQKLLYRMWSDSWAERPWVSMPGRCAAQATKRPVLITGGAGFIGVNLAHRLLGEGRRVLIYDNLSRPGVEKNLRWLRAVHGRMVDVEIADVRDRFSLGKAVRMADHVFHLAAQVAVTSSLVNPIADMQVNIGGTIHVLEAIRACDLDCRPSLLLTSTNKVYGALDDVALEVRGERYRPADDSLAQAGVGEWRPLDFHSPYGCSKGAADQYVIDYSRCFGLKACVFRMSCIYGPHQFGTEDQGWVAHFLIRALRGQGLMLYGDGMQVRDLLYVDDLVDAMCLAWSRMDELSGKAFNIGGGPEQAVSLREVIQRISRLTGRKLSCSAGDWRVGDQKYYVSDTGRFRSLTGWQPKVGVDEGLLKLHEWLTKADVAADRPGGSRRRMPKPSGRTRGVEVT
jgi:CDP-paratose 2-epimerase